MVKNKKIEILAQGQKKMYTIFIAVILILFVLTSIYTNFNPIVLLQNSDAFIICSRLVVTDTNRVVTAILKQMVR